MKAMKFWEIVKKINDYKLKDDLLPEGYIINKSIFRYSLLLLFLVLIGLLYVNDFDFSQKFYFHCPENKGYCDNPFLQKEFSPAPILDCPEGFPCDQERFAPGYTFGEKQHPTIRYYFYFTIFVIGSTILINHYIYNTKR